MRILLFSLLLVDSWFGINAQAQTNAPAIIEVKLARFVASQHVHANNQPYQWQALDRMVLYDVDGNPNAYAFVFAKSGSRFNTPAALQQHIADVTSRIVAQQAKGTAAAPTANDGGGEAGDAENDLFAFDDLATVITSATADSPLILRHFRGAPEFWVEAARMEASTTPGQRGQRKTARHVVMVTPMDFRLVTADSGVGVASAPDARIASKAMLSDPDEVVSVHSKRTERISALRQQRAQREQRERERRAAMKPEDRQRYEDALAERAAFLAAEWEKKRSDLAGNKGEEEDQ
ncbi:MAG: hypothetical protein KF791_11180 [Verrucomicrobiae bacterium]|nr:hypothetical protein [Verrucomicrobiae bacterium]